MVAAALAGFGTMAVELSAVRLIAPWFGTSQTVWTQVIAVVLLGLSVGYVLGGRLGQRPGIPRRLAVTLVVSGLVTAVLPSLAEPVSRWFVPEGLTLADSLDILGWGSLASSLVLFLVPSILFGTVAPQVVEELSRRGLDAARAGGFVLAVGTVGSFLGVYGTSEWAIPVLGLAWTFRVAASSLALGGLVVALGQRAIGVSAAALVVPLAAVLAGPVSYTAPEGWSLLDEAQSTYQNVRVVEAPAELGGFRQLQVNESYDSYQSVWYPEPGWLPAGYYYNDVALPYFWEGEPTTWRVLILGLGGGTAARVLEGVVNESTNLDVHGVELDPKVVEFARRHLDLKLAAENVRAGEDARLALRSLGGDWDMIYLDCYANQIEIPPHLATVEFFSEIRRALRAGGWLVANVGGFDEHDPIVCSIGATLATAFERECAGLRVAKARNWTLLARRDAELPVVHAAGRVDQVPEAVRHVLGPRELEGMVASFGPDAGRVLVDHFAPTERLQRDSLAYARARRQEP